MNTLNFQPISQEKFNQFSFEGKDRKVYSNINLSIFTDDYCNANCRFCIEQFRFQNKGQMYKKCKIRNDEEYFKRLEYVLDYLRPLNPSVSITGGEPTKSRRLKRTLELIDKYEYRKRVLTTNGSGLLDVVDGKSVIQHIVDNGFSHLNISRAHYNEDVNKSIMQYRTGYFSNDDLRRIVDFAKINNLRPRMSCVLLKEGVNSLDEIIKYLDFYESLGLDNVVFRELADFDSEIMLNLEKMAYCDANKIRLSDIWKHIDNDQRFTPIRQILGHYYWVKIHKYKSIDMVSQKTDLVQLYCLRPEDTVFEMVFHPNGNLNGSWVDNEDILLEYTSDRK